MIAGTIVAGALLASAVPGQGGGARAQMPDILAHIPCLDHDGVSDREPDAEYVLTTAAYREHMTWLHANGFAPMTFRDFIGRIADPHFPDPAWPARPVLLFSDTSGTDYYLNAVPLLETLAFKSTLGIEPGLLGYSDMMTDAQLHALEAGGYEIAAHSITHPDLTQVDAASLLVEVAGSRLDLRNRGLDVVNFIYPFGAWNHAVVKAVQEAGYSAARATGAADISGGGYASIDVRRRWTVNCALPIKSTTMAQFVDYFANPRIELEDIFVVDSDAPESPRVYASDFAQDSYRSVYIGGAGDLVSVRMFVSRPGRYDLRFRVKTGTRRAPFGAGTGYHYAIDGENHPFQQSGPTETEGDYLAWGYHTLEGVSLPYGFITIQVGSGTDWGVLDSLIYAYLGQQAGNRAFTGAGAAEFSLPLARP